MWEDHLFLCAPIFVVRNPPKQLFAAELSARRFLRFPILSHPMGMDQCQVYKIGHWERSTSYLYQRCTCCQYRNGSTAAMLRPKEMQLVPLATTAPPSTNCCQPTNQCFCFQIPKELLLANTCFLVRSPSTNQFFGSFPNYYCCLSMQQSNYCCLACLLTIWMAAICRHAIIYCSQWLLLIND